LEEIAMETPLKISFQGGDPSEALSSLIGENVEALEKLHGRMTACHVAVVVPDRHHRSQQFSVNIHLTLPGGIDVNVDHAPQGDNHFADAQAAVHDAFRRAKRVLKDRASKQRGDVKTLHERIERTLDRPPEP
jgi:ribosome-associated translation inhibitor RaiA